MHHYNFPPYSTGETWFLRGPKRREIGHGALAETALREMIPPEDQFPYTIRVVSEVMSSNGSTSMASVCGSTLALMAAGVPLIRPVGGIAMGLIKEGDRYAVLTDIQGMEDHLGDMDFKVAGTEKGITALQMDIKITGISDTIMRQALTQAREARMQILGVMLDVIPAPRTELSAYAPRILTVKVNVERSGDHRPRWEDVRHPGKTDARLTSLRMAPSSSQPGQSERRARPRHDPGLVEGGARPHLHRARDARRSLRRVRRVLPARTAWCRSARSPITSCSASKTKVRSATDHGHDHRRGQ